MYMMRRRRSSRTAGSRPAAPAIPANSASPSATCLTPSRPIPPGDSRPSRHTVSKPDGTAYDVAETLTGPECSCPDFTVNRAGKSPCKHLKALAACRLIGGTTHPSRPTATTNGAPSTPAETVDPEALAYKAWGTPTGDFLASQMDRLAQLIRFTSAPDGEEHEARMAVMEDAVREEAFNRGYGERHGPRGSELV